MDRWKKRAAIGTALGLAGVGVTLWLTRAEPGRILDFQPVAASRVLIARRDIHPEVQSIYLELDEPQKGVVWRRTLPHARIAPDAWNLLPNMVAAADVFVVRTVRYDGTDELANRTPLLQGFQARDGALLWTVAPMGDAKDPSGRSFRLSNLTLLVKGDLVLAAYGQEGAGDAPNNAIILALDAHTGAERWRAALGDARTPAVGPAWIRGGSLVVFAWSAVSVIDLVTGKTTASAPVEGLPCVTDRAIWFTAGGELREIALDTFAQRTLPRPSAEPFELHGPCARRGAEVWATSSDRVGETSSEGRITAFAAARLLALDAVTGAVQRRIELGRVHVGAPADDRVAQTAPDEAPLSGAATRFVPLLLQEATAPPHLVLVDLDEARIAGQTPPSERFTHARIKREGERQFLYDGSSPLLAALDGATGHLVSASTWPVADKPLLAHGLTWIRDDWSVTALDPATMKPAWSTGPLAIPDAREGAEALLGGLTK
jgi:outer membrane protein assembly factor BamB